MAHTTRTALRSLLDSLNALHGRWWELRGHGFSEEEAREICALAEDDQPLVRIRFDGGPGPEPGRFIEVEDDRTGASISWGEWREDTEVPGNWFLVAPRR